MKLKRLILPALISGVFFVADLVLRLWGPIPFAEHADIRLLLFGPDMDYLFFAALAALIIFGVRTAETVVFDLLIARRSRIETPMLLRQIFTIGLYGLFFALLISHVFGHEFVGVLATTTVFAVVIGLALQDTLGNLFAGLALHVEHSFEVGDVLRSGEFVGVVERVNWRAAQLRTVNDDIIVLPNSLLARERFDVFPKERPIGRLVQARVGYQHYPEEIIPLLVRAVENVPGVTSERDPIARISSFTESAVIYEVKYWTRTYHQRDQIDADIRRAMWYALHRQQVEHPYPLRKVLFVDEQQPEETRIDVLRHLDSVDLFAVMTNDEKRRLAAKIEVKHFGSGETILKHDEPGDSMFIVDHGKVAVRVPDPAGVTQLAELGPGSVFGEMALMTGEPRTADVVATTDVVAFEIDKDCLLPLLDRNHDLAERFSERIVRRKQELAPLKMHSDIAAETSSVLQRIRSWFGLGR